MVAALSLFGGVLFVGIALACGALGTAHPRRCADRTWADTRRSGADRPGRRVPLLFPARGIHPVCRRDAVFRLMICPFCSRDSVVATRDRRRQTLGRGHRQRCPVSVSWRAHAGRTRLGNTSRLGWLAMAPVFDPTAAGIAPHNDRTAVARDSATGRSAACPVWG